jgi:hypothetical protein
MAGKLVLQQDISRVTNVGIFDAKAPLSILPSQGAGAIFSSAVSGTSQHLKVGHNLLVGK